MRDFLNETAGIMLNKRNLLIRIIGEHHV